MKKLIVLVAIFVIGISTFAQQLQTSSLYDLQGVFHNPAMAGTQKVDFAGISYRTQWSGISGSPQTMTAFASVNLEKQKLGIGGYLYGDKTGPTSRNGIQISLAKHIPLANGGKLSFGIENRIVQFGINKSKLTATLGNDLVLAGKENAMKYDAGVGVAYVDNKWTLGVSASQLIQSKLDIYSGNLTRSEEGRLYRHFYIHGNYTWQVDEDTRIIPNFLLIVLGNAPTESQFGVRVENKNLLWWGISGRLKQSFILSIGLNATKNLSFGYSFDMYRTPNSVFESGANAHELMLRYNFVK
jgi:type IX secretion system PorP/SprF family membrane protein